MDAKKPNLSPNLGQHELGQARALYAVDFDMARAQQAAVEARNVGETDDLNRTRRDTRAFMRGSGQQDE